MGYRNAIFQCLDDYNLCCSQHPPALCGAFAALCIAQQLIPFAKRCRRAP